MSRYVAPAPDTLTMHVQSANPADMTARARAAMDTIAADAANRITSMRLAGAGDGHSFVLSVEFSQTAGGLVPSEVKSGIGFFMASEASALNLARSRLAAVLEPANPGFELRDSEVAGASNGLRFMGFIVYTNPASGPSQASFPTWPDFYISSTGNDANDGRTDLTPVQTIPGLQARLPKVYSPILRIHFLDDGPFAIPDGEWTLPDAGGEARPIQFIGLFAEDPAGGGGGTRTIAALGVGSDTIQDATGGLTPGFYKGYVIRRTGGSGTWRRYEVTDNTADTLVLALPWVNGGAPQDGDTFVIERSTVELDWDEATINTNAAVVISGGVQWTGSGSGIKRLIWTGSGTVYPQGDRVYDNLGRFGFEGVSCRTLDLVEGTFDAVSRYPAEMPDLLGLFISAGDFYGEGDGRSILVGVSGTVSFQSGPGPFPSAPDANCDVTAIGATITFVDSNLSCDSACTPRDDGVIVFVRSDIANSRSRVTTTNGGIRTQDGGLMRVSHTEVHDCTKFAGVSDGLLADGGLIVTESVTGTGNTGFGVRQQRGGEITDISIVAPASSLTGALGDLGISIPGLPPVALTWAQFLARLGTTRRNGFMTKPAVEGYLQNNAALIDWLGKLAALELVDMTAATFALDEFSFRGLLAIWSGDINQPAGTAYDVWKDGTRRAYQAVQAVGANQPTFVGQAAEVNFHSAADCDGTNDFVQVAQDFLALNPSSQFTLWLVARTDTVAAAQYFVRAPSGFEVIVDTTAGGRLVYVVGAGQARHASAVTTPQIICIVYNGSGATDADRLKVYIGNVLQTLTFDVAIPASISPTGVLTIGAFDAVPNFPLNGRIYDMPLYDRAQSDAERNALYAILAARYAL